MRTIPFDVVVEKVSELCLRAAFHLPEEVLKRIREAAENEKSSLGKAILQDCLRNAEIAAHERFPICQDTGVAVYLVEIGSQVAVQGGTIEEAINEGTRRGYRAGYLRKSMVRDPIFDRSNTGDNTPAVVHLSQVPGDRLRLSLSPKGAGSENMSAIAMLKPSDGRKGVVDFVVKTVAQAGGNPCPPTVVGVGVGGTFEKAAFLAKKALFRQPGKASPDPNYASLERDILDRLNASGIGPQGLGGTATAFAVHVEAHPCHIASLPVAVNLNCHAARHAEVEI